MLSRPDVHVLRMEIRQISAQIDRLTQQQERNSNTSVITVGEVSRQVAAGKEWLTTDEVAEIEGVNQDTVRRWIHDGRLRAEKIGGRWLVHKSCMERASIMHESGT